MLCQAQIVRDGELMSLKKEGGTLYFISPFMVEPVGHKVKCEIDLTWPYREDTTTEHPARVMFSLWQKKVPFDDVLSFEVYQSGCYSAGVDSLDQVRIKKKGKKWRTRYEGYISPQVFVSVLRRPDSQFFRLTSSDGKAYEFRIPDKVQKQLVESGVVVRWETKYDAQNCN